MKIFNTIFPALTMLSLAGCATVSSPEGGPRDVAAPTLVSSNPKDQQLNVNTNTITLEFNEEVQQNNLNKELLITPNLNNTYRVRTDKNQLQLVFEKPLQDSTTYIFNFGKGIQDITEKNIAEGIKLAFSTGSYIDSSRVSGTVVNLLTNEPIKEAVVAMYPANDTLSIRKNKPYYQTKATVNGEFSFNNIKEGSYRIYALQDQNNNSLYDNENERIAYLQEPILVTPKEQNVELKAVRIDTKKPILLKRDRYADRLTASYSEGIETFSARREGNKTDTLGYKIGSDGRMIDLFKSQAYSGGKTILAATDSSGNTTVDTLQVEFTGNFPQTISGARITQNNNAGYSPGQTLAIELQTPVRISGNTPITIQSDSANRVTLKYPDQVKLDRTKTELQFSIPNLRPRTEPYTIILDSTQILPLEGKMLSFPEIQLQIAEGGGTGSLTGKIKTSHKSFIIQLLNTSNKVVDEVRNRTSFNFRNREPGTYRIRVLIDENNNGKWDGADATFKREPEKVYFHPEPVNIRANWILEDLVVTVE